MPLEKICDDYFSSISSLARNIIAEKREKIDDYGGDRWESLNQEEQDERLNDWFMDPMLTHKYQIQLGSGFKDEDKTSFPRWQVKTGQKMVHHTDQDGSQSKGTMLTWRDEFSSPFTWATSCQQKIPLPTTENMSTVLPREDELLDSGWKEETALDGLEQSILTDFGKEFTLTGTSTPSANDWTNTSSCSREKLIDESSNIAPSAYRVRNAQENLKLDLQSSFDNSSPDRKQRSPKREKKSPKRRGSRGSASPKRESSKSKVQNQKKDFESPSSPSMDFPSVTDSLLPKAGSTHHSKQSWTDEPKTRVVTQQPTSWNENPTFMGNARTNGIKSETSKPPTRGSTTQAPPASQKLPAAQKLATAQKLPAVQKLPAAQKLPAEIDLEQFTLDAASPQNDNKPLKFTDFEDKPAEASAEGSGDAYNFLLDW